MNDKDIIKALECCGCGYCPSCPYGDKGDNCDSVLLEDVFALIKRQQEEIGMLKVVIETSCVDMKIARAEAIKDFVERWHKTLKETRERGFLEEPSVVSKSFEIASNVTAIVSKEMLGKEDEGK